MAALEGCISCAHGVVQPSILIFILCSSCAQRPSLGLHCLVATAAPRCSHDIHRACERAIASALPLPQHRPRGTRRDQRVRRRAAIVSHRSAELHASLVGVAWRPPVLLARDPDDNLHWCRYHDCSSSLLHSRILNVCRQNSAASQDRRALKSRLSRHVQTTRTYLKQGLHRNDTSILRKICALRRYTNCSLKASLAGIQPCIMQHTMHALSRVKIAAGLIYLQLQERRNGPDLRCGLQLDYLCWSLFVCPASSILSSTPFGRGPSAKARLLRKQDRRQRHGSQY